MSLQEQAVQGSAGGGDTVLRGTVASVSCNDTYSFSKPTRDAIVLVPGIGVDGDVHAGVHVRHRSRVAADPTQPNLRQVHLIRAELFDEVGQHAFEVAPGQLGENVTTLGLDLHALPRGTVLRFGAAAPAARRESGATARGESGAAREARPVVPGTGEGVGGGVGSADAMPVVPGAVEVVSGVVAAARVATLEAPVAAAVAALVDAAERADRGHTADDPRPAVVLTGLRNPCAQIDRFRRGLLGEVAYRDATGVFVRKAGVMGVVLRGGPIRPGDPIVADLPPAPHSPLDRV